MAVFYDPYSEILKPTLACGNNGGEIAIWDESLECLEPNDQCRETARVSKPHQTAKLGSLFSGQVERLLRCRWAFNQVIVPRAPDLQPVGFMVVPIPPAATGL